MTIRVAIIGRRSVQKEYRRLPNGPHHRIGLNMPKDIGWKRQFASDTVAAVCPQALRSLQSANEIGFVPSYGEDDEFTVRARKQICQLFGKDESGCSVSFVSSGTVANALAMASACQSFDGVLCHPISHLEHDEANAPEYLTGGAKLLHVDGRDGKIDPNRFFDFLSRGHGYHSARLRMISITQATEVGTIYTLADLRELRRIKNEMESRLKELFNDEEYRLYYHMDGARLANAVAALQCDPSEIVAEVDVLSFGGSKNGAPPTEAIVFFNPALARDFTWRVKQTGQLVSKMRYLSAPWLGMLKDDVWLDNARHANSQARRLGLELQNLGFQLALDVESNMIFVRFGQAEADALQLLGWDFYPFQLHDGTAYRFVCNWSTTDQAVDDLLADVKTIVRK